MTSLISVLLRGLNLVDSITVTFNFDHSFPVNALLEALFEVLFFNKSFEQGIQQVVKWIPFDSPEEAKESLGAYLAAKVKEEGDPQARSLDVGLLSHILFRFANKRGAYAFSNKKVCTETETEFIAHDLLMGQYTTEVAEKTVKFGTINAMCDMISDYDRYTYVDKMEDEVTDVLLKLAVPYSALQATLRARQSEETMADAMDVPHTNNSTTGGIIARALALAPHRIDSIDG